MQKIYPDIFNDVFGPIMQPGSSSHTAGPCRIGYLAHCFLGENLQRILVILDSQGSFAGTFGHMNEDLGMLAGAYGLLPDDVRIFDMKEILREEGIPYEFTFDTIAESDHANAIKFVLTGVSGTKITLVGNSTGGGMVEIVRVNDFPVSYHGESFVAFAEVPDETSGKELVKSLSEKKELVTASLLQTTGQNHYAVWVETSMELPLPDLQGWFSEKISLRQMIPVLPVANSVDRQPQLFDTVTEWIRLAKRQNQGLFELAVSYEQAASGWSRDKIVHRMENIASIMDGQAKSVYETETDLFETPFSGYHYQQWERYEKEKPVLGGELIGTALKYAFGAQTMSKGIPIVPGPMGNGGAYIYSVLKAIAEHYERTNEDLIRGLFIAGIIGVICYTRSEPTGEVTGCTGECGMCAAMASAGAVEMLGGTPEQVEAAASLTLQATTGWPCDPIPGGFNQPCTSRVVSAITLAITFADLALSGRDAVIPFHEALDTADKIGRSLPPELKCTSRGGLCSTKTGMLCQQKFQQWHKGS